MDPIITIRVDMRNVQQLLQNIPRAMPKVVSRSINRTIEPVRTYIARQLVSPMNELASNIRAEQKRRKMYAPILKFSGLKIKKHIGFKKATYKFWRGLIWIKESKWYDLTEEPLFITHARSLTQIAIFARADKKKYPIYYMIRGIMRDFFEGISEKIQKETEQRLKHNVDGQIMLALKQWQEGAGQAV